MDIISLTDQNISSEHICCALDSKTSNIGVAAKKEWLCSQFSKGATFKKLNARGKVFIEYIPAENAWAAISAKEYMFINCHWVSGSYKRKGYGKTLLEECEKDARKLGMKGVVVIVGNKKKPFLSEKVFYTKYGYEICDTAPPYFELLVKRFDATTPLPVFAASVKKGMPDDIKGIDIFYTAQCPFTVPYIDMLKPVILLSKVPVRIHQIKSKEEAQIHFSPTTTYSVFVNGKFHTNEILTPDKLEKLTAKS